MNQNSSDVNVGVQFPMGAVDDDTAATAASLPALPGPGGIVERLGQQFQYPRAQPDDQMSERPANNLGEIG
jgi:hypothetical protein